ncbi:MmyB family transcriptional regulator [Streptosporangium sandarakinum]|uniref:MmyB family transcriptional regulator n=1 Tax=Streptosporangium sandarakinum TaxID=1260955 RepID=UPI003724A454
MGRPQRAHPPRRHQAAAAPQVGGLELTYQSLDLPMTNRTVYDLTIYTAEPGTASEDRLKLLASLAATRPRETHPTDRPR